MKPQRVDGRAKVEGAARYTADAVPRPHLFAAVITVPEAPACVSIDTRRAGRLPGVVVVLTEGDLAPGEQAARWSANTHGGPPDTGLLTDRPRHRGEPVAAIAAESRGALAAAVRAVGLDVVPSERRPPRLLREVRFGVDHDRFEQAYAAAPRRFAHRYDMDGGPIGFLEPVAVGAAWPDSEACEIWSSCQSPSLVLPLVADIVGVAPDHVRWHPTYVGGGFGGKDQISYEPLVALLSRAAGGAPVLLELSRAETNRSYSRRNPASIELRTGVDDDGRIVAREVILTIDAGADHGHSGDIAENGAALAAAIYPAAATTAVGRAYSSPAQPSGAFRGYGATEVLYGIEASLDEIANEMGIDPITLRLDNALQPGGHDLARDWPVPSFALAECLERGSALVGWPHARQRALGRGRWRRGLGVAALMDTSGASVAPDSLDTATVACRLQEGRFFVETATVEMGTGAHTSLSILAAGALGVPAARVVVEQVAPQLFPGDSGAFGSRAVYVVGNAVVRAATKLRSAIGAEVAHRLGCDPDTTSIEIDDGVARVLGAPCRAVGLSTLGCLRAQGTFAAPDSGMVAGAQFVEVMVDTHTGHVAVERVCSVHDVGRLIHPDGARGQVYGGIVQGLGLALTERSHDEHPDPLVDRGFLDHLIPTFLDVPRMEASFVEVPHPAGDIGAKGLGEAPVLAIAPAVANAVADAIGVRIRRLPITSERVLDALQSATSG